MNGWPPRSPESGQPATAPRATTVVSDRPAWIALGTHANKQGRVVGLNVSGSEARFPGVIGTAVTKVGTTEIGRTGLTEREAVVAGIEAVANTIEGTSRAHYYPDGTTMSVKMVVEVGTGRLLGAQIVGGPESAKRIDAIAVAVWNRMTADEFAQLDLGYAPPFSPVWDPHPHRRPHEWRTGPISVITRCEPPSPRCR